MEQPKLLNDMLHLAFEACPAAMLMVDASGRIELVNEECEQMFGYRRGELIGRRVEALMPRSVRARHVEYRGDYAKHPTKRLMGVGRELVAARRDGSAFFVEVGLTPVETAVGPRIVAFAIDITARLESERSLRRYMSELQRANENLSRFAYIASHDIQEPLRKITAFADILDAAMKENDQAEALYASEVMATAAQHARNLVKDLLSFARSTNDAHKIETIALREAIGAVLDNLSQTILDERAEVECSGESFAVEADRSQLEQMLQNLISNALKYHKQNQAPRVRIAMKPGARENALAIEDEGIGFASAHNNEIFEPFRRLHGRGDFPGTGIGLAICKSIADRHGWSLSAHSTPTLGSTFEIIFPKEKRSPLPAGRTKPVEKHVGDGGGI
jgi:PAS domain S-box-containing protein